MAGETSLIPDPESLFEDAPCGLIVTREDGSILRANKTLCSWVGWGENDLEGRRFQDLLTMGGRIFHQTHWAPLIRMQGSVAEVKLDLVHRDKTVFSVLLNGVRQQHESGVVYQLALFCTTDRDKYERELLKARQLAEELLANKVAADEALSQAPVDSTTLVAIPETLGDLHDQLAAWGSGLYDQLHDTVYEAVGEGITVEQGKREGKGEGIIILVWIPRTRDGEAERFDVVGYMLNHSLFDLASALDMLGLPEAGRYPRIYLLRGAVTPQWRSFPLLPVEVRSGLNPQNARDMSGTPEEGADIRGVLAGVGALGSVLANLWIRQGWGQWTLIDPDRLLPHNLSRHTGFDSFVGLPKVEVVREIAKAAFPTWEPPKAIFAGVLEERAEITTVLATAEILVDATTTFEVPRMTAKKSDAPRTASLFLTPSGLSSVMILEDRERSQRVDGLEGQYYRAILQNDWGSEHLAQHLGDRWVGGGCRDISLRMPNEYIHTHAGILSRQLRQSVAQPQAKICVWESSDATGAISFYDLPVARQHSTESAGWTVKYDAGLVEKLYQARIDALPNETGGSILGVTDLKTKTIVVVDVLPTPPDSQSSPSHFIRGQECQAEALENVHKCTAGVVDYVGEWHSHPDGCAARPSNDDERLLDTLQHKMSAEGLPALMIIVGQTDVGLFVRYS